MVLPSWTRVRLLALLAAVVPVLSLAPASPDALAPAARSAVDRRAVLAHRQMQEAVPWAQRYRIRLPLALSILRQADRHQVPRILAFKLVREESNFDSLAVNKDSRACGLTQLLPSTARRLRPSQPLSRVCHGVEINLDAGLGYYAALHRMFQGDWRIATTAYFLGPGAANEAPAVLFDTLTYTSHILD